MAEKDRTPEGGGDALAQAFDKMLSETEPVIPPGLAETIEKDLAGAGALAVSRRLALVYLSAPFKETCEKLQADRDFAVAVAHVTEVLAGHVESYRALAEWLDIAHKRMGLALAVREDMDEVLAEAKAQADKARDELHKARFLRSLKPRP